MPLRFELHRPRLGSTLDTDRDVGPEPGAERRPDVERTIKGLRREIERGPRHQRDRLSEQTGPHTGEWTDTDADEAAADAVDLSGEPDGRVRHQEGDEPLVAGSERGAERDVDTVSERVGGRAIVKACPEGAEPPG